MRIRVGESYRSSVTCSKGLGDRLKTKVLGRIRQVRIAEERLHVLEWKLFSGCHYGWSDTDGLAADASSLGAKMVTKHHLTSCSGRLQAKTDRPCNPSVD